MAAFSRGLCRAQSQTLSQSTIFSSWFLSSSVASRRPILALQPFSTSTPRNKASASQKGRFVKQRGNNVVEDRIAALRNQIKPQSIPAVQPLNQDSRIQNIQPETVAQTQPSTTEPSPLLSSAANSPLVSSQSPTAIKSSRRRKSEQDDMLKSASAGILEKGEPVVLYLGPNQRWQLSIASGLLFSAGAFMIAGTYWAFWDIITDENYNIVVSMSVAGTSIIAAFAMWGAIRRRALMVRKIQLIPRTYGTNKIFEVEVTGTGFVPFTKQTVVAPIWEVSLDRPIANAYLPPRKDVNLQEYFNGLRPFIWLWQSVKGIFREMRYVTLSSPYFGKNSVLLKMWMEENGNKFNYWLLDARASALLGGHSGFDYFIRPKSEQNT